MEPLLTIRNLHVQVEGKEILKGVNLVVQAGEVHALMGPNGSGKSTLAYVLAGKSNFEVTEGEVFYQGQNLLSLSPEDRSRAGLFLAFQYPLEIPGVSNAHFLKEVLNIHRKHQGKPELDAFDFMRLLKAKMKALDIDEAFIHRSFNEGFSGGEKKRNEILQMLLLEPSLAILDEIDSGLDIDALKIVAQGVNASRSKERAFVLITHYQRLLNYIVPDYVHILSDGKIVKSGTQELARELEEKGYAAFEEVKELA